MQTSFHEQGLEFFRAPDVPLSSSDVRRYSASGESLDALKARTTPMDITNPYTSSHASCANAFIATAISIEHRFDEIHLQLPVAVKPSIATIPMVTVQSEKIEVETSAQGILDTVQPAIQQLPEPEWNFGLLQATFSSPSPQFSLPYTSQQSADVDVITLPQQSSSEPHLQTQFKPESVAANEVIIRGQYQQENDAVTFSGEAPAGTLLHFYLNDVLIGSTEIDDAGYWQFDLPAQLPEIQHTFSAVPISPQGVMGSKTDFPFIIEAKIGEIILPADDSESDKMDLALIERVTQQEEPLVTLLPQVLIDQMPDIRASLHGLGVMEPMHKVAIFDMDELEMASAMWH